MDYVLNKEAIVLYVNWLRSKNLSINTIDVYTKLIMQWQVYLNGREPTKTIVLYFINEYAENHKPRTVRLMMASIISFFKFERRWKLIKECEQIKLPSSQYNLKSTIKFNEFNKVRDSIVLNKWKTERDWLIFSFLFYTGIRISELIQVKKTDIFEKNKLIIRGKGNKQRIVYLNDYLVKRLKHWNHNRIAITSSNKTLTTKQINIIIKTLSIKYFDKYMTAHGLRRSYATNLLRSNVNIEIVRRILGHSDINTTSKYIQYTDDEIIDVLRKSN